MFRTAEAQAEFVALFNAYKQEVVKLAEAAPEIIARIEESRRSTYMANQQAQEQSKQSLLTATQAAMATDQPLVTPPRVHVALSRLNIEQAEANQQIAAILAENTLLTGNDPDPKAKEQIMASIATLTKLNSEIRSLALFSGEDNVADPKQAEALAGKIKETLTANAELKDQLRNLKSSEFRARVGEPGSTPQADMDSSTPRPGGRK